jgi:hypothetical protein
MSAFALLVVAGAVLGVALAAPASGLPAAPPAVTASGPAWSTLAPAQQQALAPLQSSWQGIDEQRKMKWLEVAERFPRMPADERARVQQRMSAWAAMAPADRARARLQFQESRGVAADERQARWKAYQALPEDERKRLALAAKKPAPAASATRSTGTSTAKLEPSGPKRNVVATAPSPSPRSVTPTVVQAKPGATTTTVATVAKPPLHHQPGLPKIVSTPGFVDPNTLLPRRGPQAAAMRAAASADPTQQP